MRESTGNNPEGLILNEQIESATDGQERKYISNGEYREYKIICRECDKEFTRSIPKIWFNGADQITGRNLPENLDLKTANNVFKNPLCGACQPDTKNKLDIITNINNQ